LYIQYATGIKFIEYEDEKKTISIWKSSFFTCELDGKFLVDSSKVAYRSGDGINMEKLNCINCNKPTTREKLFKIPVDFITKFAQYMRCLPTYEQLKIEQNDILNYVNPVMVLEHSEEDVGKKGEKQHITELKIGVC
jgi:hypothetical protein